MSAISFRSLLIILGPGVSHVLTTREGERQRSGTEVLLEVSSREVPWLKVMSYASIESCALE